MSISLKHCAAVLTMGVGIAITGATMQAVAAPLFQDHDQNHDQDYSKNKTYQQGMKDGRDDQAHHRDHSKKRHYKKDEDQKAYEAGYQKAHGN